MPKLLPCITLFLAFSLIPEILVLKFNAEDIDNESRPENDNVDPDDEGEENDDTSDENDELDIEDDKSDSRKDNKGEMVDLANPVVSRDF